MIQKRGMVVSFLLLYCCLTFSQAPRIDISTSSFDWTMKQSNQTSDGGDIISSPAYDPSGWHKGTVPGTVFSTLVDNNVYTDPYIDRNIATQLFEKNIDIAKDAIAGGYGFWFRTTFTIDNSLDGRQIWLRFKGINYKAEVWVNGRKLNNQDGDALSVGAFKHFYFDITSLANFGADNGVAVKILPNSRVSDWHQVTAQTHGTNGGYISGDGPSFTCSDGWDWIPTIPDRNMGIYNPVILEVKGPVAIREPFVNPQLDANFSKADITITAVVHNSTSAAVSGKLYAVIEGNEQTDDVSLNANEKKKVPLYITITNPKLWWPNGYGEQNLYTCAIRFEESGKVSDSTTIRFGCRKVATSLIGTYLNISINDKKIMCKGGNWGMDEAMKRRDPDRIHAQMRFHKEMNATMIRNWVGQTDQELFYDLADQYGLLIYDDFWVPHPADGPDPVDKGLFTDNAIAKIKRIRNHPCITLYCGKNEGDRNGILNNELTGAIDTLHNGMTYVKYSTNPAEGLHGNGPYGWRSPDVIWAEAYGFTTEIGMPSVWVDRTGRRTLSEENLSPVWQNSGGIKISNEYWGWHDFCGDNPMQGNAFCNDLVNHYDLAPASGNAIASNKEFCKYAQIQNYDGYRAMFEAYNSMLSSSPPTGGILIWMSNCSWPSNLWQTYDYYLDANGAYFATQKACEPIHVQATYDFTSQSYKIDVVNNTLQALSNYKAIYEVWSTTGVMGTTQDKTLNVPANSLASTGLNVNAQASATDAYFINAVLKDADNKTLSTNVYARGKSNDWNQLKALKNMAKLTVNTELAGSFNHTVSGATHLISGTISNTTSDKIAHMVRLTVLKKGVTESGSGAGYVDPRILPTYYSTNYFTLFPKDTQAVSMEYDDNHADGKQPELEVTGFTVNDGIISIDPVPAGHVIQGVIQNKFIISYVPLKGIMVRGGALKKISVSLFNMLGRMVDFKKVEGAEKTIIGERNIPSGLYIVKITVSGNTKPVIQRVVVL